MKNQSVDVLITGAGPTGLVLALWLTRAGVRVRIIDKTAEPGTTSRAVAVQGRTLELYAQLGLADAVVERGRKVFNANIWISGKRRARLQFGSFGADLSPFSFALIYPQDEHERLLIERLAQEGVEVERSTELLGFEEREDHVVARLRRADGAEESCVATYLAGCDGAHSTVRTALKIGFEGGTYEHVFYVADVEASGAVMNGEIHVGLDAHDFLALFPLKDEGRARLVGTIRDSALAAGGKLAWSDVKTRVIDWIGIDVTRVHWFSTYRVHHRVATQFRRGRAFLLGDAAHIHSPVGGQGMNTGIGDAVNLAWKLADVIHGGRDASLLDTYEPERIGFAQRLVKTTDQGFTAVTSSRPLARFVRLHLASRVLPSFLRFRRVRRAMFHTLSQLGITYRHSALSAGKAGNVHGGDRLPWTGTNFDALKSLGWQVHVYGEARPETDVPLHVFPWTAEAERAGLQRNAAYLVRPDGYVAVADWSKEHGPVNCRGLLSM
ncbi:MAG TPA: FAD-dependent monooxygenase [Thermoanaerobaculia bacterium]|nr:FAD-dependent monooxygenase [Thermoanaerobaculia bacterium]